MTNSLIIEFSSMDNTREAELLEIVFYTDISINWARDEKRIYINWDWGQESNVEEILNLIGEICEDVTIEIYNGEDNKEDLTTIDFKETSMDDNDDIKDITEDAPKKAIEQKEVGAKPKIKENIKPLEKEDVSKEEYETVLKEALGSKIFDYDFSTVKAGVEAERFCIDFDIKSEALKLAITFSNSTANENQLINILADFLEKNRALTKVELKKSFEKWIKYKFPNLIEKYPNLNVIHFLNIFREEGRKI